MQFDFTTSSFHDRMVASSMNSDILWTNFQDKHSGKILHIFLTITKKQVRGEMEQPINNCLITFNGLADYFLQQKQSPAVRGNHIWRLPRSTGVKD